MNIKEKLNLLGLTRNEQDAYLTLLKTGETAVGNIIRNLNIHRQSVYNALDELEKRELIVKNTVNGIYHYKIIDPGAFLKNIKKQTEIAEELSAEVSVELGKRRQEQEINIFSGRKEIRRHFLDRYTKMPIGSPFFVISNYAMKFEEVLGKEFLIKRYNALMIKRKISVKIIAGENKRKEFKELTKSLKGLKTREFKYVSDNLVGPGAVEVSTIGVSFLSFLKNWFIIEVKNDEFRNAYLKHFETLWKIAKS